MNQRPRLLLDCDGVLADFTGGCRSALRRLGYHDEAERISTDVIFKALSPEAHRHLVNAIETAGFCHSLEPMASAVEAVRELESISDVYVVTSPWWTSPHWCTERVLWLESFFGLAADRVVLTRSKHLVVGDHFVDDHDSQVVRWCAHHPKSVGHLWQPPATGNAHWIGLIDAVRGTVLS